MSQNDFDRIESEMASGGAGAMLDHLADQILSQKNYRDLFTVRQMQVRLRLGLPMADATDLGQLQEPQRSQLEKGYLDACREVGRLFLSAGAIHDAWTYLRISGDKQDVRDALENISLGEDGDDDGDYDYERAGEIIEVALHEGVWPLKGLELILSTHGICNTITALDGAMGNLSPEDQRAAAGMLVRYLHEELVGNVRADIKGRQENVSQEKASQEETTQQSMLADLLARHDDLLAGDNYHIDTTHLASVIRFARTLEDADDLRLALDLTEYGRRLSAQHQFEGEPPFGELYSSHAIFFRAALAGRAGEASAGDASTAAEVIAEAVDYFGKLARASQVAAEGSAAVEFYVALLSRVGRHHDAIDALAELMPAEVHTTGVAPSLLELAERAGDYDKLLETCRQRGDLIGFAMGMVEARLLEANTPQPVEKIRIATRHVSEG